MNISFISDLHLEFRSQEQIDKTVDYFNTLLDQDFLILAGDIHSDKKKRKRFFEALTVPYKFVMGNHDFFKTEVYDDFFDEDGIVGGCLWTNFNNDPNSTWLASRQIWDFKYIPNWTTEKCIEMNQQQVKKIFDSPSEIVVTHFPPSFQCIANKHKGDPLNDYFNNNLDDMILNSNKKLWICGHTHVDFDFMIGDCRVVSNNMGYPNEIKKNQDVKKIVFHKS